ncbi:MAG TPA: queuosine precursor transporter [Bacillota bacterium]|jgi:uncharacterized integral membrane protein (TIGR00697 family)|nr:queuosine precursor transporter [Bacillota bacterium]HOL10197.1 queuosine precursor transporter [Bacillota bacterium]HPO97199.1 queuosine precursor transporter [Bacillota bacterium]
MKDHQNPLEISPLFLILTCFFITCLLVSNIIAEKLIDIYGIALPAAVILFPITYIFGDILTEVYGYRLTKIAIWLGFGMNLFMSLIFVITIKLPYPAFWSNQEAYSNILGVIPRIVAASLIAYLAGELLNSMVLSKLKVITEGRWLWLRTIGSTIVGQAVDSLLFITIAFLGSISLDSLFNMFLAQYLFKVFYEVLATPLTYLIVTQIKRIEKIDIYDRDISYNPLLLWRRNDESKSI